MAHTSELRLPTQERGTRRVQAILDAAAQLLKEVGVEGLTVQALSIRAETSKGSLYHFFPDVPAVLRALADRHLEEIDVILSNIVEQKDIDWGHLPAPKIVKYLLAPLDYLERNPDLLEMVRSPGTLPRSSRSMAPMHRFATFILGARFPHMNEGRRSSRAAVIVATIDGAVGTSARGCVHGTEGMRRELEEMLECYVLGLDRLLVRGPVAGPVARA